MDYDADGRIDIVTGSYTGQFYVFRRDENGGFAQRELFVDESGATLLMPFDSVYSVTPELVDMDADGDLDLVVGNRSGEVQVVTNLGTRAAPVWSKQRRTLTDVDGRAIEGSNAHHADWDGDGVRDLVIGSEHGNVSWHRNVGANDAPRYAAGVLLLAPQYSDYEPEGSVPKRHGSRVKVHVADWNLDGRPDLLVGDVTWQTVTPEPLSEADAKAKAEIDAAIERLQAEYTTTDSAERKAAIEAELAKLRTDRKPYQRSTLRTHGWVWLYLREMETALPR